MLELHESGAGHYAFDLTPDLARFDGRLFGGAGLAAAVAVAEAVTERAALWSTVQFVGYADIGERIDCQAEVLAAGFNTSQVRVTATAGDRLVFTAIGSTARGRDDGFGAELRTMPNIPGPDDADSWMPAFPIPVDTVTARGPFATAEFRIAQSDTGDHMLWARMKTGHLTRLTLAYLGDFVPSWVLRAAGRSGGGTSLDNSIRFGRPPAPETEWILIDTEPYFAEAGYLHGSARLWSLDGQLLAVASQTAVAKIFD